MTTRLSRVTASVLVAYVVFPNAVVAFNFSAGDLWLLAASAFVMVSRSSRRSVSRFFARRYFGAVALTTTAMLTVALLSPSVPSSLKWVVQFTFILWLVIPIVAAGVAEMDAPLRFIEVSAWVALAAFGVGAGLHFGLDKDWIVRNVGNNRYYWAFHHLPLTLGLCLGVAHLAHTRQHRLRRTLMVAAVLVAGPVLSASRTGIVVAAFVIAGGFVAGARGWRAIVAAVCLFIGATWVLSNDVIRSAIAVDRLYGSEFFQDESRAEAAMSAVADFTGNARFFFFGVGWGSSGAERVVTHNVPLQIFAEAGVFVGALWLIILGRPAVWLMRGRAGSSVERTFSLLLYGTLFIEWMFHPISTQRMYWLAFAVICGMAYRLRYKQPSRAWRHDHERTRQDRDVEGPIAPNLLVTVCKTPI